MSIKYTLLVCVCVIVASVAATKLDCSAPYSEVGYNGAKRNRTMECFFQKLDRNRDGEISKAEYEPFYEDLPTFADALAKWTRILSICDCDGDGLICRQDAMRAWKTCFNRDEEINFLYSRLRC